MFFDNDHYDINVIFSITDKLSNKDAFNFLSAHKRLNKILESKEFWVNRFGVQSYQEFAEIYKALGPHRTIKRYFKSGHLKTTREKLQEILHMLEYSEEERALQIYKEAGFNVNINNFTELRNSPDEVFAELLAANEGLGVWLENNRHQFDILKTDEGILALRLGLITVESALHVDNRNDLYHYLSYNGIIALSEGLIKLGQLKHISDYRSKENLLNDNGIIALRQGLVTPQGIRNITSQKLSHILSDGGLIALGERLITLDGMKRLDKRKLRCLLSQNGITALREGLISLDDAKVLSDDSLNHLLTGNGIMALSQGWITMDLLRPLTNEEFSKLHYFYSDKGQEDFRSGLINRPDIRERIDVKKLEYLLSDNGIKAFFDLGIKASDMGGLSNEQLQYLLDDISITMMIEGLITFDQFKEIHLDIIKVMMKREGSLVALREGLITLDQMCSLGGQSLSVLLNEDVLAAIREKIVTVDEAASMPTRQLFLLSGEDARLAYRDNLISFQEARNMSGLVAKHALSENGLLALREKLITVEEINKLSLSDLEHAMSDKGIAELRKKADLDVGKKNPRPGK